MRGHIFRQTRKDKEGNTMWQSPNYTIVLELDPDPVTGKRKQQWLTLKGNKKAAEAKLTELLNQVNTGVFVKSGKLTVREHLTAWLQDYCKANLSPRTWEMYSWLLHKHVIPEIGNIPLSQLKPQALQHLFGQKLSVGLSNRTVQIIRNILHRSFVHGIKTGALARNPVDATDNLKVKRRTMKTMSESDLHLFLEMARDTEYYSLFYLLLFSGLRRGEAIALRWYDVDLLLCQIAVTRSLQYLHSATADKRISFKTPKSGKGRLIALSPSTVQVLKEHKVNQAELRKKLELPTIGDSDLVFCHFDGSPLLPDSVTHAWVKLARRCGLSGIRLHDARHTHASLMLKQGIHPKIVQERLGHASIAVTLDIYSHVAPGLQQAAANKFDEIVLRETPARL